MGLGMATWRFGKIVENCVNRLLRLAGLLLLFLLHLPLLVEDLLGLAVADEEDDGGEDQDDRAPGAAVAKAKGVGAGSSWSEKVV